MTLMTYKLRAKAKAEDRALRENREVVLEAFIALYNDVMHDFRIKDESRLPYPRRTMINTVLLEIGEQEDQNYVDALGVAVQSLAYYQADVGEPMASSMSEAMRIGLKYDEYKDRSPAEIAKFILENEEAPEASGELKQRVQDDQSRILELVQKCRARNQNLWPWHKRLRHKFRRLVNPY